MSRQHHQEVESKYKIRVTKSDGFGQIEIHNHVPKIQMELCGQRSAVAVPLLKASGRALVVCMEREERRDASLVLKPQDINI